VNHVETEVLHGKGGLSIKCAHLAGHLRLMLGGMVNVLCTQGLGMEVESIKSGEKEVEPNTNIWQKMGSISVDN